MATREMVLRELDKIPEPLLDEVLHFVRSLQFKAISERAGTAIASESSLAKDWLKPEEDEAWQDL